VKALALLLALLPVVAAAQVARPELDAERLAAYNAARLYIQGMTVASVNAAGLPVGEPIHTWTAYRGDAPLTEMEFYRLVGRDDLLAQAVARQNTARNLTIGGGVALAIGTVGVLLAARQATSVDYDVEPEYDPASILTSPAFLIGMAGLTAGGLMVTYAVPLTRRRATHAVAAQEMTERYNVEILRMLTAPPPPPPITLDG